MDEHIAKVNNALRETAQMTDFILDKNKAVVTENLKKSLATEN